MKILSDLQLQEAKVTILVLSTVECIEERHSFSADAKDSLNRGVILLQKPLTQQN